MRVLVTGASGFVGKAAALALRRRGHGVLGLVRDAAKGRALQGAGADLAVGDMWRPESYAPLVQQVDAVVHAAQQTTTGRWSRKKIRAMHESDALMSRKLATACLEQNKPLIYTSGALTHAGYGDVLIDESLPPRPCLLARGHAEMLTELQQLHRSRGLRVIILSPGFVYGPDGFLQTTIEMLRQKKYRVIGSGTNWWSLVHVDDVGEAYPLALERGRDGENYFLSDDLPLRRREVTDHVSDALGLPRVGHVPGWIVGLMMGFPMVEAITASARVRNDKAKTELGWKPTFSSFAEALPALLPPSPGR